MSAPNHALGHDPARWPRACLAPRPPAIERAVDVLGAAVFDALTGDVAGARRALAAIDTAAIVRWYRDEARTAGAHRARVRGARRPVRGLPGRLLARWRPAAPGPDVTAELFRRDHGRCRFCGAPVLRPDQLARIRQLVGADVLDAPGDTGEVSLGGGLWLLTGAVVEPVRLGRRDRLDRDNLVIACRPCRDGRDGRTLAELGLDDPRDRPPGAVPAWTPLLTALDMPVADGRAVVRHALLLDGSTLNVAGELLVAGDPPDGVRLVATVGGAELERPVEVLPRADGVDFRAHVSLLPLLGAGPRVDIALVGTDGRRLVPVVAPGSTTTPNAAVTTSVPVVASLGVQLRFDERIPLTVRVQAVEPLVEVAGVRGGSRLEIRLVSSPMPSGAAGGTGVTAVTAVWLQRRGPDHDRVPLEPVDAAVPGPAPGWVGEWRLGAWPPVGAAAGEPTYWDVWAAWEVAGERRSRRIGRRRGDLLDLRSAVTLPRATVSGGGVDVRLVPYYATSRHLTVKATASAAVATPEVA